MTLRLGGDGAITGCTSLENPDLTVSGLTISGSFDAEKVLVASGTAAAPSYTFSGDTDNGLYYAGTNSIGLATAGTNAILIDSSARVGIGTTSPAVTLHIDSALSESLRLEHASTPYQTFYLGSNRGAYILSNVNFLKIAAESASNSTIAFDTNNNERMRIDSSGRVGIGTDSPSQQLTIKETGGQTQLSLISDTDQSGAIYFGDTDSTLRGVIEYNHTSDFMRLYTSGSERLRIDSSGNVGIGTASPQTITGYTVLTLNNSSQGGAIEFKNNNTSYGRLLQGSSAVILETKQNIPLVFGTGTSSTERMRVLPTGGLTFNGDTATANALDDYEVGTFTPTLTTANGSGSLSWNNTTGYYVKVGNVCTASFYSSSITITNNGSAHALITGLPFTAANLANHYPIVHFAHVTAFQNNVMSGFVSTNTGNIYPLAYGSVSQVNWTTGNPVYLMFSVTYRTN